MPVTYVYEITTLYLHETNKKECVSVNSVLRCWTSIAGDLKLQQTMKSCITR